MSNKLIFFLCFAFLQTFATDVDVSDEGADASNLVQSVIAVEDEKELVENPPIDEEDSLSDRASLLCSSEVRCFTGELCSMYMGYPLCDNRNIYKDGGCDDNPCEHGGACLPHYGGTTGYRCRCVGGAVGPSCETSSVLCTRFSCLNGGICITVSGGGYRCQCRPGFSGIDCSEFSGTRIDKCDSVSCGFGTCETCDCPSGYRCRCVDGVYRQFCGGRCSASSPCLNGAACTDITTYPGYRCVCKTGYTGNLCQNSPKCLTVNCGFGICKDIPCTGGCSENSHVCKCYDGFDRQYCPENPSSNQCASSPCLYAGTCKIFQSSYKCFCMRGYTGKRCQNAPKCLTVDCGYGVCVDEPCTGYCSENTYFCRCSDGVQRQYCPRPETATPRGDDSDVCISSACTGPGCRCVPLCKHEGGYYCISESGYIGKTCNIVPPTVRCEALNIIAEVPPEFAAEYDGRSGTSFIYVSTTVDGQGARSTECKAELNVGGSYEVAIPYPFIACGNQAESQRSNVLYKNTLWINQRAIDQQYDFPFAVLDFTCTYADEYAVVTSLRPYVNDIRTEITYEQRFSTSIGLCKVSTCSQPCPSNLVVTRGAVYTVSEIIHLNIGIDIPSSLLESLSIFTEIRESFLSCGRDGGISADNIDLHTGCESVGHLDVTTGQRSSTSACMSFRVPRVLTCSEVFIHINLVLCDSDLHESVICTDGRSVSRCVSRGKRSVNNTTDVSHHVIGPITIVKEKNGIETILFNADGGKSVVIGGKNVTGVPKLDDAVHAYAAIVGCISAILLLGFAVFLYIVLRHIRVVDKLSSI